MGSVLAAVAAVALQVVIPWDPVPPGEASYLVKTGPGFPDIAFFPGQGLVAPSCGYQLDMRWNGILSMDSTEGAWYVAYPGVGTYAVFQSDGNLVLYQDGWPTWATDTSVVSDPPSYFTLGINDRGSLFTVVIGGEIGSDASSMLDESFSDGQLRSGECPGPDAALYTELYYDQDCAGSDYAGYYLDSAMACGRYCAEDNAAVAGQCAAFAWDPPGTVADQGVCWLKQGDPYVSWAPGVVCGKVHFAGWLLPPVTRP